jgi:hypothetical protein
MACTEEERQNSTLSALPFSIRRFTSQIHVGTPPNPVLGGDLVYFWRSGMLVTEEDPVLAS